MSADERIRTSTPSYEHVHLKHGCLPFHHVGIVRVVS